LVRIVGGNIHFVSNDHWRCRSWHRHSTEKIPTFESYNSLFVLLEVNHMNAKLLKMIGSKIMILFIILFHFLPHPALCMDINGILSQSTVEQKIEELKDSIKNTQYPLAEGKNSCNH
jgi:hypothetical protein